MTTTAISKAQIADTLSKIRAITEAGHKSAVNQPKTISGFDNLMKLAKQSLNSINTSTANAETLKESYLKGDSGVSLPQVLISSVQSKIAFEGLLVVRNKLIDAYKEIMNIPL